MTSTKRGFTLVELLVVISMIAIILASFVVSISGAQQRVRVQKATSEVKAIAQAVLGYENYADNYELEAKNDVDIDASSCGFLLGKGKSRGAEIPVLLMAALSSGKKMLDPWGTPYKIKIRKGSSTMSFVGGQGAMKTSYVMPNVYRLGREERK